MEQNISMSPGRSQAGSTRANNPGSLTYAAIAYLKELCEMVVGTYSNLQKSEITDTMTETLHK